MENKVDYKPNDFTRSLVPDLVSSLSDFEEVRPATTDSPDDSMLSSALDAFVGLAGECNSFLDPLRYIRSTIIIDIDGALAPAFDFSNFVELHLERIANSPLFEIIFDTLMMSSDKSLLLESVNLVVACACVSKDCILSMVNIGLHHSLFSLISQFSAAEFLGIAIEILNALTIIWKRLSSIGISSTLSFTELDDLFQMNCPLLPVFSVPFARLLLSFLAYGSLDASTQHHVAFILQTILCTSFHIPSDDLVPDPDETLGQLADIFIFMNRCGRLPDPSFLNHSHVFADLSQSIHLLSPATASRVLVFYEEYTQNCQHSIVRELLNELNCETLIEFLTMDDSSLMEAALNIISLMIELNCIEPDNICNFVLPTIIESVLKSLVEDLFGLKHTAIRFVHAIVLKFGWLILPDETFRLFVSDAMDFASDETLEDSVWFLESLVIALHTPVAAFCDHVKIVCDELNIWGILEEFPRESDAIDRLLLRIEYMLQG
jgi:hypothetical protein